MAKRIKVDQMAYKLQRLGRLLQLLIERSLQIDMRPDFPGSGKKPKKLFKATLDNSHFEGRGPDILLVSVSEQSATKRAKSHWRDYHNSDSWRPKVSVEEVREVDGYEIKLKKAR